MQRPIRPEWLLRQADDLAGRNQGAGQPRSSDLRRAVSAAYYAVFHAIVLGATAELMPQAGEHDRWQVTRHFEHGAVRNVCDWVVGPNEPPPRVRKPLRDLRSNADLFDAAQTFVILHTARHEADYDHTADFTKPGVLTLIDSARDAVAKLAGSRDSRDHQVLATHLALATRIKGK